MLPLLKRYLQTLFLSIFIVAYFGRVYAAEVCFELNSGVPIVLAAVADGPQGSFVLDSGCKLHVIDTDYRCSFLSESSVLHSRSISRPISFSVRKVGSVNLGGISLDAGDSAAVHDLGSFETCLGFEVSGLIGARFFLERITEIDFGNGLLEQHENVPDKWLTETSLPLRVIPGNGIQLCLEGNLLDPWVSIDTGFNGSLSVSRNQLKSWSEQKVITHPRRILLTDLSVKASPQICYQLQFIHFGPFTVENVEIDETRYTQLIGTEILSRFNWLIDLVNMRAYFKPIGGTVRCSSFDRSGMKFFAVDGDIRLALVEQASPAERAGIQAGDRIVAFDGKPVAPSQMGWLRDQLKGPQDDSTKTVTLTITRDDQTMEKALELIDYTRWPNRKKIELPKPVKQAYPFPERVFEVKSIDVKIEPHAP